MLLLNWTVPSFSSFLFSTHLLAHLPFLAKESLFGLSLFPYLGFLWFLTRSQQTPRLALIGFYTTLLFVAVTIPIGIYAKTVYGQELANVDVLHGGAEVFLTLANILVVLGFRQAILSTRSLQTSPPPNSSLPTDSV